MSTQLTAQPEELRERFYSLKTRADVAGLLEIDEQTLIYYLYRLGTSKQYVTFQIPKRSGGFREICAPVSPLKIIQKKLNQVLQAVYKPRICAHSFTHKRSILTNARAHAARVYVLNIDLKDFFPSINFGRIRGLFKAKPYELNVEVATVIAQICCWNNQLPQGAPTSPIVSNMICARLDGELNRFAREQGCRYTRYADDMTFSTRLPDFPEAIARIGPAGQIEVGAELKKIIEQNWFSINVDKIRYRRGNLRQVVTGLTVNRFPNVKREFLRRIRAMLHAWETYGLEDAEKEFHLRHDKKYRGPFKNRPTFKQVLKGRLDFVGMVRGKENLIYLKYRKWFGRLWLRDMYEILKESKAYQSRGYSLEKLLNELFALSGIKETGPFRRNEGAEQIDGAFELGGWHYLVECRWRKEPADMSEIAGLYLKVEGSGGSTKGLFLSVNGWSQNVPNLMKRNPNKKTILMNGDDLEHVLGGQIELAAFIREKSKQLDLKAEPFYSAQEFLKDRKEE